MRRAAASAVIDASAAVKLVYPEEHWAEARRVLTEGWHLCAPAHWLAEATIALWSKAAIRREASEAAVLAALAVLERVPVAEVPLRALTAPALRIALRLRITPYDALYLALAERDGLRLVTGDRPLHRAASADPDLAPLVLWVGDLATADPPAA